jgi:putative PEP-CTERM system TPR-repeat lipoprotein
MSPTATNLKRTAAIVSAVFMLGGALTACNRGESTATLLAEAKDYQQKGDRKAALIQLKNAVAQSPDDAEARIQLGALHLEMGDTVSADKEIRKARSLGMSAQRTQPLLAKTLQGQGKFKELLDEISADTAKNSAPLLVLRGEAYLATGDAAKAKESFEQALALAPNSGAALVGLARHAMMAQDVASAERYVADAAAKDPKNPEVWMFKGAILHSQNKRPEALAAYDQALALKPDHRTAHIEKAYLEIGLGKFDAAKADIDAANKTTPGSLIVAYTQALLDFNLGKYAAAQESLQKVLRSAPEHMPSILLSGAVELNLGATQQAEQHLRKFLSANPDNLYARKMLAQAQLKSAQPGDAVATLAPALKEPSQDAQLLALAGESYMQARDFDKATAYFEKATALAPKAAVLHTSLGLSRVSAGHAEKGISDLETAAALDPKSARAGIALVQAELNLKHYDKALAAVQALEKQQPDSPQVQNLKGGVYLSKGDRAAARAAFGKAVSLQPGYFAAVSNLAQLDVMDRKPEAAKQRLEAVLAKDPKSFGAMSALADLAVSQNRPDEAATWLEKATSASPDAIAPVLKLGAHYLRNKQPQKALTLARKHQTAHATNPELLDMLGQSQLATGDQAAALDTYSKLVNVLPKSALAQLRLATVQAQMKNESAAAESLKRAAELQPDLVPVRGAQIELAMRQGKVDEALAVARALQKHSAQPAAGYVFEGDILLNQKKAAQALSAYAQAYRLDKTPQLTVKLAEVMKQAGRTKDIGPLLADWRKQHPNEPLVAMYTAETHLANKQYKPAIGILESLQKNSPPNPALLNNLAWAYQQEKDPRALATAEQALKLAADSPAVMDTLGWLLVEQGDAARGVGLLQKAVAKQPDAAETRYHLAVGLNKTGDKAGARKELEALLAQNKPFAQVDEARALLRLL